MGMDSASLLMAPPMMVNGLKEPGTHPSTALQLCTEALHCSVYLAKHDADPGIAIINPSVINT